MLVDSSSWNINFAPPERLPFYANRFRAGIETHVRRSGEEGEGEGEIFLIPRGTIFSISPVGLNARMFSPDALRGVDEERAVTHPDKTRQLSRLFLKRHERHFLSVLPLEGCKA